MIPFLEQRRSKFCCEYSVLTLVHPHTHDVGLWFGTCLDISVGEGSHPIDRLTTLGGRPNCYCSRISRGIKRRLGPDEEEDVDADEGCGWTP